jgi:transposase
MPFMKANRYGKRRYAKVGDDENRTRSRNGIRKGFDEFGDVICEGCFSLRNQNAKLKEEVQRLRQALKNASKTTKKDIEAAHTPSSARRYKEKSTEENRAKVGGATAGHKGYGRRSAIGEAAEDVIYVDPIGSCPDCNGELEKRGSTDRTVVDAKQTRAERLLYRCPKERCRKCKKVFSSKPPVLPRSLYGNTLLAQAMVQHYVHGVPLGRLMQIFGPELSLGGITNAFHRVGRICEKALPNLIEEYRQSKVRHADETGWRTDGKGGYAWIFATSLISIFEFTDTRSSRIPAKILGEEKLKGVLVVDRYGGYNKMQVNLQYCYAHLMREIKKLSEEFSENAEVQIFSSKLIPLMALAMKLRLQDISDREFYEKADETKRAIELLMQKSCRHLGIKRIQEIFTAKQHRLYHWAKDRDVPAENNRAEREIRPTVIARKVSFGSQSPQGCKTRQAVMSVLYTAKKRLPPGVSIEAWLKSALDQISIRSETNIYGLLPTECTKN